MRSLLDIIAVIFVIGWALGFFVYIASGIIHVLLTIGGIVILFRLCYGSNNLIAVKDKKTTIINL